MIKCKVEEETKQKFKVGDKITNGKDKLLIVNIVSDKYIVEDNFGECGTVYFNTQDYWKIMEEENKSNIIEEAKTYWDSIKDAWICPEGYQFVDENGNVIETTKIILEKKKKEYPKTYEECINILGGASIIDIITYYYEKQLKTLYKLLICRDAYWKIAGEEMGLGEPWKPDWSNDNAKYSIYTIKGVLTKAISCYDGAIFVFPTEEMRDVFKENFDPDIKICKEFL